MATNKKNRGGKEVNASSTADIAFLLLIFFLVTTTIDAEKGITVLLPEKKEDVPPVLWHERNIFKILVGSENKMLVKDEPIEDVKAIRPMIKEFILNNGRDPKSSDDPKVAIVSFKTNRGTSYETYITVLDEIKGAYYEIYGERVGLTPHQYRSLDEKKPKEKVILEKGKEGIPMNISIAEPSK